MKIVKESLYQFERGKNVTDALNIGMFPNIDKKLVELYLELLNDENFKNVELNKEVPEIYCTNGNNIKFSINKNHNIFNIYVLYIENDYIFIKTISEPQNVIQYISNINPDIYDEIFQKMNDIKQEEWLNNMNDLYNYDEGGVSDGFTKY